MAAILQTHRIWGGHQQFQSGNLENAFKIPSHKLEVVGVIV